MLAPVGFSRASWSRVRALPPAARMRARAVAVNRRAAIWTLGTSSRRLSSVTVPTTTTVFLSLPFFRLALTRDRETGGRLMREVKRRRRTTLLKAESVRPVVCEAISKRAAGVAMVDRPLLGLTSQEAVQLHEELEVRIVALGRLAVGVAHVVAVEIDTYKETKVSSSAFGSSMLREVCGSTRGQEVCYDLRPLNPNSSSFGGGIGSALIFAETVSDRPLAYKGFKEV